MITTQSEQADSKETHLCGKIRSILENLILYLL